MKPLVLLAGLAALVPTLVLAGPVSVTLAGDPSDYIDLERDGGFVDDAFAEHFRSEIQAELERVAARRLPEGHSLAIEITDVDLAGEFEPWRGPRWSDVRIVKDIYPPMVLFRWTLTDASGAVVREGEQRARDSAFLFSAMPRRTSEPFVYEQNLLADWMRREFR